MLEGQLILSGTAQKDANAVSEKFAVANVRAMVGPTNDRHLFFDLVGFNGKSARLGQVKDGDKIRVLCHPESHKGIRDGARWAVRFVLDEWLDEESVT